MGWKNLCKLVKILLKKKDLFKKKYLYVRYFNLNYLYKYVAEIHFYTSFVTALNYSSHKVLFREWQPYSKPNRNKEKFYF